MVKVELQKAIDNGYPKAAIARILGTYRVKLYQMLKDNSFTESDAKILREKGIIK